MAKELLRVEVTPRKEDSLVITECNQDFFRFHPLNQREIRGRFDGGAITSDGGGLLLREVEKRTDIIGQFAGCFTDFRDPELIEHTVAELVGQRVYGLALGYEDLNDHDELRRDPLLAVLAEKKDPTGEDRRRASDQGMALAGKSTLNRLELGAQQKAEQERYKKIILNDAAVDRLLVDIFLQAHPQAPAEIVLDVDSTDIPLHGEQEQRFFHGYYGQYCYLPLYIVCGEYVLCARLRPSNIDGAKGCVTELERILAQNAVVLREMVAASAQAAAQYQQTGQAARVFTEFQYRTKDSWSRARRVIAKAEHLEKGANPRLVVTSLSGQETIFPAPSRWAAQSLYEEFYCARGDMENRIKEQMMLFADRTSTSWLRSNQIRLYFSTVAYQLLQALRRLGLTGTELAKAQCNTVRLKLLKIGALIRITVRKVWISWSAGYPYGELFHQVHRQLQQAAPLRC